MSETLNFGNKNLAGVASLTAATFTTGTTAPMQFTGTGSLVSINAGTSGLTETLTVSGNTSFVGNVTVTSDASGNAYVLAKRVPAGSLSVANYVTGSVPLTTTTNFIQGYLSNVAMGTRDSNVAVILPGVATSNVFLGPYHSVLTNPATSNIFMEAWVYTASGTSGSFGLLRQGNDWIWEGGGVTKMSFDINSISGFNGNSTTTVPAGWVHLAVSYVASTKTKYYFLNGTADGSIAASGGTPPFTSTAAITIGRGWEGAIRDVRVMKGSIVPVTTFVGGAQAAPFTTAPTYRTGMDTGYTSNLTLALNSQYFPGASTSPYGPCLTLPGTVGSYYSAANSAYDTNWRTSGFCLEMWINYASFANATNGGTSQSSSLTFSHGPGGGTYDWGFGAHNGGGLVLFNGGPSGANTANSVITTGSWNHIMVQGNGSNIYMAVNGTFQALNAFGYSPAGGNNTIAPTQPSVLAITSLNPVYVGSAVTLSPPNFALAKARLVFGTSGANGNVYSSGNFTPNPNFNPTLPSGATVAWQLESQYPLPTYPSIQDVTELPQQASSYGALPTPIGGVTSNTLGPYTANTQFDSIRFDGTGYIDYGNAASSSLTTNIWASNWTIEGWAYFNNFSGASSTNTILGRNYQSGQLSYDWLFYVNNLGQLVWRYGNSVGVDTQVGGPTLSLSTWYHVAATYDGARTNVYCSINSSTVTSSAAVAASMGYNPTYSTQAGFWYNAYITGNLADVRVSNVARYTGSSYTVPTAPFATDSNTLLLLKSLAGQTGTTLEVQGRGLNAVSLGATRSVQSYPPAPMTSYLLDTTSNALVTYGQGKYIVSASSERTNNNAWMAYTRLYTANGGEWQPPATVYSSSVSAPGTYTGSVSTVDTLGNSYAGEWLQMQLPVSVLPSSYTISISSGSYVAYEPGSWVILGSRDGINWTLVATRTGVVPASWTAIGSYYAMTVNLNQTQAYNYWRMVVGTINSNGSGFTVPGVAGFVVNGTEESLCVTNDSKVGVGIANPQRALEVAGDLVVGGTISGGAGMGSFRNRIINGDMRIAQRGTSNVISTGAGAQFYMIDRFAFNSNFSTQGLLTQTQQTLTASDTPYQTGFRYSWRITTNTALTAASYGYTEPQQIIEGYNISDLNWGTSFGSPITVSFWFRTNLAPGLIVSATIRGGAQYAFPFAVTGNGTWQYVTATVPPPPNGGTWNSGTTAGISLFLGARGLNSYQNAPNAWITVNYSGTSLDCNPYATAGNYIEFTGVQLEKGTVASPFEFRPYATELALCQRYYKRIDNNNNTQIPYIGTGVFAATTLFRTGITHNIEMRAQPTVTTNLSATASTSNAWIQVGLGTGAGQYANATSVSSYFGTGRSSSIDFTTTGQTAGAAGVLWLQNAGQQYIDFNAEL